MSAAAVLPAVPAEKLIRSIAEAFPKHRVVNIGGELVTRRGLFSVMDRRLKPRNKDTLFVGIVDNTNVKNLAMMATPPYVSAPEPGFIVLFHAKGAAVFKHCSDLVSLRRSVLQNRQDCCVCLDSFKDQSAVLGSCVQCSACVCMQCVHKMPEAAEGFFKCPCCRTEQDLPD